MLIALEGIAILLGAFGAYFIISYILFELFGEIGYSILWVCVLLGVFGVFYYLASL